jgi:DNA polymerase III epsilon subunit family exonuclease
VRTSQVRVAIDLETTGLHPEHDAIIEIGALKFAGDEVLETFESFVTAGAAIPYRIQRLTGISGTQLRGAPALAELLPRLRDFLGDHPLVGHSVPFDAAFLRRVGLARRNPLVDTYELASALLPGLPSYTLASVGAALGVRSPTYHRALADAQLARDVFLALLERLRALDASTLLALDRLPAPLDWTPAYFVRQTVRQQGLTAAPGAAAGSTIGDLLAARLGMDPAVLSLAVARGADDTSAGALPVADPSVAASDAVEAGTAAASSAAADRLCQIVSDGVRDALAAGHTLLVEHHHAADGVLACLGAILQWAYASGARALICVADESAARQLIARLIPTALAAADIAAAELPVASLCARESYLCLHRWYGAARLSFDGQLPRDTARGLAKLAVWLAGTQTGALGEVTLSGQELAAWERTRAGAEFIDSDADCAYRRDRYCFVARARAAAERARVIVTTHRALAAQLVEGSSMLDLPGRAFVFDAHLLEDELRAAQSLVLDRQALLADLGALALVEEGGRRGGLFHLAAQRLDAAAVKAREQQWFTQVQRTRQAAERLFTALRALLADSHDEASNNSPADGVEQRTLRLDAAARELAAWRPLTQRWEELAARLAATVRIARDAAQLVLAARGPKTPPAADGVATELLASARRLERALDCGARILTGGSDDDLLRWLRVPYPAIAPGTPSVSAATRRSGARPRRQPVSLPPADADPPAAADVALAPNPSVTLAPPAVLEAPAEIAESAEAPVLHAAPVQVGALLAPLYAPDRGLVLAAPALAVGGDFAYTRAALGLSEAARTLGPAIECENQTLLCLPTDVPEPNAPQFQRRLDDALLALASALGGRLVVLFPSHAALRSTAQSLKRALERHDILALAQGQDGSVRQLWQTFRTEPRVVLLGAGAFWEGAAQTEMPPACIVVTRLPFPALSDPLLAARADQWADAQSQFVVPHAALRLRHALGGLAWSHTRKNAIVLFDRRIQTRAYGPTILATLPRCEQYQGSVAQIAERTADWVG